MKHKSNIFHLLLHGLIVACLCMLPLTDAAAQQLTGIKFEQLMEPLTVPMQKRDLNGRICALIKVQLPVAGCKFEGNVVDSRFDVSEYWVYMTPGTKRLDIKCPGHPTCSVVFGDISSIVQLGEKGIYSLTFDPRSYASVPNSNQSDGFCYLVLNVKPADAIVSIDGQLQNVRNGVVVARMSAGSHTYRVEAVGYASQSGSVQLAEERKQLDIALESLLAQLRVECPTSGAQIFINDSPQGSSPWNGNLAAGNYLVEARLDGHVARRQTVTLVEREQRTVRLPALDALTGILDVNYMPVGSEVWIDGVKAGTSPDMFREITVGLHTVEIKADGYQTAKHLVNVKNSENAELRGELSRILTRTQQPVYSQAGGGAVETFTVNGVSFNMVRVEGGTFRMGSKDKEAYKEEKKVHDVTLSDFYIGKTEVTQGLWEAVMGTTVRQQRDKANKSRPIIGEGANYPMYYINWDECQEFISRLNALTGRNFRMPTEAEWEYAARGGCKSKGYKYSGSYNLHNVAWYNGNSDNQTHPVRTKGANELGIYGMSGNVWEWCSDWYSKYPKSHQTNPSGHSSGSYRVIRGGSWSNIDRDCRVTHRDFNDPRNRGNGLGLRLALSAD